MHTITDRERQQHGCEYCAHNKKWTRECPHDKCPYAAELDKYEDYFEYCKAGEDAWLRISRMIGHEGISRSNTGISHGGKRPVRCIETGVVYDSVKAAVDAGNGCSRGIIDAAKCKTRTSGGYHWEYADL